MHNEQWVDATIDEVLASRARDRAQRTGETFERALEAIRETEAGQRSGEPYEGSHSEKSAQQEEELAWKRAEERRQAQQEERRRARQEKIHLARIAAWKSFMHTQRLTLELRKDGQLAELLGEALPGESPSALERLASADQRQAEEGLVMLMSDGKVFYKHVEELLESDMPARRAAERLRTTWLKERRDVWLGRGEEYP